MMSTTTATPEPQHVTWCESCINYLKLGATFGTCIEHRDLVDSWMSCRQYKERVVMAL